VDYYYNILFLGGNMVYCSECGKELNDDSKFCTECGKKSGEKIDEELAKNIKKFAEKTGKNFEKNAEHFGKRMELFGKRIEKRFDTNWFFSAITLN